MNFAAVLFVLSAALADGYKILTYAPRFGQSHVFFVGSIADTLQEAGHNVTFLQTELVPNVDSQGATAARVVLRKRDFALNMSEIGDVKDIWKLNFGVSDLVYQTRSYASLLGTSCYHLLRDDRLMEELKGERFDLLIGEHYDACTYGLVKRLEMRKFITAFAFPILPEALRDLGHPTTSAYIPQDRQQHGQEMTYGQRVRALVDSFLIRLFSEHLFVRPMEYERIFESSVQGVVLVSFGSVALSSDMPNTTKAELVRFFSNFPDITFVFKYERPADESMPQMKNVVLKSWVPQSDMLADQQKNAQMAKQRGFARVLQRDEMTAERMSDELRRLIAPASPFKQRARELGAMIEAKPFGPRERVVRFAEHAIRFDVATNLDLYARRLSTVEFYALDIWLPFCALVLLVLWIGWRFFFLLARSLCNRQDRKAKAE
ncbi:Glucuronosyltransferase [Aphelenchoides fujianensis]|nr:Glucuronosyltransferase [Aphelenchoides fujianensis]